MATPIEDYAMIGDCRTRFASAAAEFTSALLVNPYDHEAVGAAIARALTMPLLEQRERHKALWSTLLKNDVAQWADRFLAALAAEGSTGGETRCKAPRQKLPREDFAH